MIKKLGIIHTTPVTVKSLNDLAKEMLYDVQIINILDDSLLTEVLEAGCVTPSIHRRMARYAFSLQNSGVNLILDACSSVGEVAERIGPFLDTPILRIDRAMAEEAVSKGKNIGVIATVQTTLEPTARLLERRAMEVNRDIQVERVLCSAAYEALISGNPDQHDEILKKELMKLYVREVDVVVLAQASMTRVVANLPPAPVPVLSSPKPAMLSIKKYFS